MTALNAVHVAKICHQANKAYCENLGDYSQKDWDKAEEWQRRSCINGVIFHWNKDNTGPGDSHANWLEEKTKEGWKWGSVKDTDKKEHPYMVPFGELSTAQQMKDIIFVSICKAMKPYAGEVMEELQATIF